MMPRPAIAILSPNVLMGIGLKGILEGVIPMAEVTLFTSFEAFEAAGADHFFHYFVAAPSFLAHEAFFRERARKCILLTHGPARAALRGMHTIDVFTDEERLVGDIRALHHGAHPRTTPPPHEAPALLTERERDVLRLLARGAQNKEIAGTLGIGLTTVITHRRNIMEKFHARTVADLLLNAIAAGYVDIEEG